MNIDKIISIVRKLNEENGGMAVGPNGFTGSADPKGPLAGYDKLMPGKKKKYIYGGKGSRTQWMQRRNDSKNK
jgi:hypothetical protein